MKNKSELILKIVFSLSLPFVTLLLSTRAKTSEIFITLILSFIIATFLSFKVLKNEFKNIDKKKLLISLIITLYIEKILIQYSTSIINLINNFLLKFLNITILDINLQFILALFSIPSLLLLVYILIKWITPKIKNTYLNMSRTEKLLFVGISIVGFLTSFIIYNKTNCFYQPTFVSEEMTYYRIYDVIYTTDSSYIFSDNAYLNINMAENDIRQPFFGLFSMPFSIIAFILSDLLSFVPNGYAVFLNTIQICLLGFSVWMITKMLKLSDKEKVLYSIFSFCTFPMIIFSFTMEQYIFALFYLILTIYINHNNYLETNYLYIGAVGTLITSGIIFPLISKFKSFKNWVTNILKCFFGFICVTIISGQSTIFIGAYNNLNRLMRFSGKNIIFVDKFKQFLYFVKSIFIAPTGSVKFYDGIPSYRLNDINFICITGIIILLLCLLSIILNRKNRLAVVSFLWVIFSFVILCALGWGTQENGLILYSLYFSWAYLVLIYLLINKIVKNIKLKKILIATICIILLIFNIPEFINIIKFGIQYYGV